MSGSPKRTSVFSKIRRDRLESPRHMPVGIPSKLPSTKEMYKDLVESHHIKQRDEESIEYFVQRFKAESRHVKGAPECIRIFRFMHGITNPELIKYLHDNIPKLVDEMMRVTTTFLRREKGDFRNQQRSERRRDKFTLLTKSPKEILALDKGKFKTSPLMTTLVEKRNNNKFFEIHMDEGHNTDKCMHLRRKIKELIKNEKLSHVIKELKQGSRKGQPKVAKKVETSRKDKPLEILMVQPWERVARQRITQSFSANAKISFPPLEDEEGTQGPMIIEEEIGRHFIHRVYVDGGSTLGILYEHCFNRLRDAKHSTSTWMNFVVARSLSPYNGIIGRLRVRKIQAVSSTTHIMLKFVVPRGILTLWSSRIIPLECIMVFDSKSKPASITQATKERIRVVIHPEYLKQTIAIGSTLTEEGRKALCELLGRNLDIFSWKPEDMIGVLGHLAEHCLNVREGCLPVKQKKRSQAPKRSKAIQEEIKMAKEDEEIITSQWIFCYSKMPFGLKNAEATYQRLVDKVFQKHIDFIVKRLKDNPLATTMESEEELPKRWTLFTYESSCIDGSGAGLILKNPEGKEFTYVLRFRFDATNSEPEYEALIDGEGIGHATQVKMIRCNQRGHIQEILSWTMVAVHGATTSKLCLERNSLGVLQYARRNKIDVSKSHTDVILLANNACRCKKNDSGMLRLAERANKSLGEGIKECLDEKRKDWIIEVPHVLWAHCYMIKSSNRYASFSLTYKTKAVNPTKIHMPTLRIAEIDMMQNDEALEINLYLLEEIRDQAEDSGKLGPKWVGPYEVTEALGKGAYKLMDHNGELLS
uniref:Reverse transcriptase domain-containing protein n=1 Tax=Tanacetum cinerariifolium TaxID=118510 RepID=A0A6L2P6J7_TANCI|nr:hypothetical protein [Tanacetum cinerariifolium]